MKTIHTDGKEYDVRIERKAEVPKLVSFNKRGHTVYFAKVRNTWGDSTQREEGYDDPENFFAPQKWWAHDYMTQRDATAFEGVPWINMREAVNTDAGFKMALNGPMVDVDLADDEINACPIPSDMLRIGTAGNQFGTLLAMQDVSRAKREKVGPLDSVSIAEYVRRWKEAGAEVGIIRNGQFQPA